MNAEELPPEEPCDRCARGAFTRMLPEEVREAITDGWSGLTLVTDPAAQDAAMLVCIGPSARLAELAGGLVTLSMRGEGTETRALTLAIEPGDRDAQAEGAQEMRLTLDLAYPEARALVRSAARAASLGLMWVALEQPAQARLETLRLGVEGANLLATAAERAAEWHVGPPLPLGLDEEGWRAATRGGRARLVALDRPHGEVILVVPRGTLEGLDGRRGRAALVSGLVGAAQGADDLVVRFAWGEPSAPVERRASLRLTSREQRRLAHRLSRQRAIVVVAVGEAGGPGASVRVSLGAAGRRLLAAAAAAATRRALGD
jgi:hypothetical protein